MRKYGLEIAAALVALVATGLFLAWVGEIRDNHKTPPEPPTHVSERQQSILPDPPASLPSEKERPFVRRHIVAPGDWLSTICPNDWQTVAKENGIQEPDVIHPGQVLTLTTQCDGPVARPTDMLADEGHVSEGGYTDWKHRGADQLGCDTEPAVALSRFSALTDEDRQEFLRQIREGEGTATTLERGMVIGDMLGKKKIYPNTRVAFTPKDDERLVVYAHERIEESEGVRTRILMTLNMPTMCCNYALLVERKREEPTLTPLTPLTPPPPEEAVEPTSMCAGPCARSSLPQDCAMPGCVLRGKLSDTNPACAASCAPAPEPNSDPDRERGVSTAHDGYPRDPARATFTVLGGAVLFGATTPEEICRRTPDTEYRGMRLHCMPDGTVRWME